MSTAAPLAPSDLITNERELVARRAAFGPDLSILSEIYQPEVNLSVWNREVDPALEGEADALVASYPSFQKSLGMSIGLSLLVTCAKSSFSLVRDWTRLVSAQRSIIVY